MTPKQSAIEKLDTMQQPKPKRRSATEQALAPLEKRLDALLTRRAAKLARIEEEFAEIGGLERAIATLRGGDDAPESE